MNQEYRQDLVNRPIKKRDPLLLIKDRELSSIELKK